MRGKLLWLARIGLRAAKETGVRRVIAEHTRRCTARMLWACVRTDLGLIWS